MKEELNVDLEKTLDATKVSRIMHLRRILLIHSYFYYLLDDPIVPDDVWQAWADELAEINEDIGFYDEAFKDWDGTTGYHLPFDDRWVVFKALQIKRLTRAANCIARGNRR